ncbi:TIGR03085 family metal-binding protein [Kineosporia sp. NBRC 101731]|uniref:TIGR03085 family metal-binding protein n=1 Tax=Kineosporia sp. NBRC 101731 TaxID=3032199 RepID=UPI0024A000E8|nr:TIGR03085 family metal-binding protein [Kineosporia sp. NBRC 101731]GLY30637.1 TIGR03085 family protein [Kineosporia sp. NBRC 101731]
MPSHSAAERQALADALAGAGPGAPTLCAGWTTTDLAVHLVLREGRPHVRLAGSIGPAKDWAARQEQATTARPYEDLVTTVRNGPPRLSPMALPGVDSLANLLEHFVHCEDVRRAAPDWEPRALPGDRQAAIWKNVTSPFGKVMVRKAAMPVSLQVPGGEPVVLKAKGEGPAVTLVGEPGEIAMYLFGRKEHARVELLGDPATVARFRETPMRT